MLVWYHCRGDIGGVAAAGAGRVPVLEVPEDEEAEGGAEGEA